MGDTVVDEVVLKLEVLTISIVDDSEISDAAASLVTTVTGTSVVVLVVVVVVVDDVVGGALGCFFLLGWTSRACGGSGVDVFTGASSGGDVKKIRITCLIGLVAGTGAVGRTIGGRAVVVVAVVVGARK